MKPRADAEVAVVGAGVMGLATARALAQAGRDVVVCEQFEVGHGGGSSHGGSRIVRLSYPEERWVRLAQEAYPLWQELEAAWGRALLDQPGTLDLGDWQRTASARGVRCAVRGARRGRDRAALPDPAGGRPRAGSSRQTAGSSTPTWRCRRCSARRPSRRRGASGANADRVDRGRGRDGLARRAACEGRRRDGGRLGAGTRRSRRDADARDDVVLLRSTSRCRP